MTGLDWLNYYSPGLKQRAAGGSYRQWGCGRLKMGLSKAITQRGSLFSGDAFLGRCIRAGILYLVFSIYQMPGAAYGAPFAYVTNAGSENVSVINIATNTVLTTITVGSTPEQVAVTPKGLLVYAANSGSNNVSVIATASNTVIAEVPVGTSPTGVAITPDGAFVYAANFGSNNVSVIATASNTVSTTIPVEQRPDFLTVSRDGASVFVPNQNSDTVSVIATATNTVTATISVGANPTGIATTPADIPSIPTLSARALVLLLAAMAAVLALRIVKRQASPPPRPPREI